MYSSVTPEPCSLPGESNTEKNTTHTWSNRTKVTFYLDQCKQHTVATTGSIITDQELLKAEFTHRE